MEKRGLTKKRMPSASFCHRSTILLSSSSAALEYIAKSGPELSPKLDSPCNGWFVVVVGGSRRSSTIHIWEFGGSRSNRSVTHLIRLVRRPLRDREPYRS